MLILIALLATSVGPSRAEPKQQIFLPPDCDSVTIVGKGFKLELSQLEAAKSTWREVAEESAQVEVPRGNEEDKSYVNEKLFEETKAAEGPKDYGPLDADLLRWIGARATSLLNRIERYNAEIGSRDGSSSLVVKVLLLNTLVDLENLNKEQISSLRWLRNKLNMLLKNLIKQQQHFDRVMDQVKQLIEANRKIEKKVRGKNNPGNEWLKNTQSLRRILHEQRFSRQIATYIVEFLAGSFNLMRRSNVYDINKPAKSFDDGLRYGPAKGLVPAEFPWTSQDAIANGAYV